MVVVVTLIRRALGNRRPTLAGQFLILQLVVVGLVLTMVGTISVRQSTADFRTEQGSRMRMVAEYLASSSVVRKRADEADAEREIAPVAERSLSLSGASTISIALPDGQIVASSNPTLVETQANLGDSRVREGRSWTGDIEHEDQTAIASHSPVLNKDGELIAIVIVEDDYPSTWQRLQNATPDLLLFLGIGAALGVAGSWLLARLIKRRTRGLEPREIATLADHREALLHSIREGVIGISPDGVVTVLNDSACALLGMPADAVGRPLDALDLPGPVRDALRSTTYEHDMVVVVGSKALVLNRQRASSAGRDIGTVTTLRDRTELVALESQLDSTRSVTDTLRSQTHEFANQLHTISGLVQLGEYDDVQQLVGTLTRRRAAISDLVTSVIDDPPVAALLIAKVSAAQELGIDVVIDESSRLTRLDAAASADVATVLGNLVDNAIHASTTAPSTTVDVFVGDDGERVDIQVRDHGPGIPVDLIGRIFERGFSTKPA
ncbi:MAG: Spo0B domain-containing protein, partial [Actinomycetia bacterium]|nr:Spo0B domain-containing protein [Actinomycetes bacterium]